ncbi:uncharacterized protein LOC136042059 isoform X2 [Artemia franciscana]
MTMPLRKAIRNVCLLKHEASSVLRSTNLTGKVIYCAIIFGYLLSFSEAAVKSLTFSPAYLFSPYFRIWTVVTHWMIEFHLYEVVADFIIVHFCDKLIEPLWGKLKIVTFFALVNIAVAIVGTIIYACLYMLTLNLDYLFEIHMHGLSAYVASVLVALAQIMPDTTLVQTPVGKITNRNIPFSVLLVSILFWSIGLLEQTYPVMYTIGMIVSWIYLKYSARDLADNVSFARRELAKNKKKKQVVLKFDSDEEIQRRGITNVDFNVSLNVKGELEWDVTDVLREIDTMVNQSVFVEQQDGEGDRSPTKWTDEMKRFYNNTEDFYNSYAVVGGQFSKDKELWKIDPDDRHEESIEDGHFDTYEEQCSYCKQIGHCSRECLDPTKPIVCSMCGDIDHNLFQCQFAMCLNCGTKTAKYQDMCSRCRDDLRIICSICKMQGHQPVRCPDLWRRYHLSTEPAHVLAPCTPPHLLKVRKSGCCNCASQNHCVSSCPFIGESVLPPHSIETIFSYENPVCDYSSVFKRRKIDDEQVKEVDEPRKFVGDYDCDIASRCVHYKITDIYSLKFRKCICDEVKKIWPEIALDKCPKTPSNSKTYLIDVIHIDGASKKIKKKVASYLDNAFDFLRCVSFAKETKAESQNIDKLLLENREALLNEHFRESSEWKELFCSFDRHVKSLKTEKRIVKKERKRRIKDEQKLKRTHP